MEDGALAYWASIDKNLKPNCIHMYTLSITWAQQINFATAEHVADLLVMAEVVDKDSEGPQSHLRYLKPISSNEVESILDSRTIVSKCACLLCLRHTHLSGLFCGFVKYCKFLSVNFNWAYPGTTVKSGL